SREVGSLREVCRANAGDIAAWSKVCDAPKIRLLLERKVGVKVPLRTLQRFLREDLPDGESHGTVRIDDPDPGVLEFDFLEVGTFVDIGSGEKRVLFAALMTASVSRHQFLWPCLTQDRDAVIEALEEGFRFFGGVFPMLLPDNCSPVVDRADPVDPKLNLWFVEYAQSRGFQIDPARARKPKDKARVERQVRFARRDCFGGKSITSLQDARDLAVAWSRDSGMRVHGTTRRRPLEDFEALERGVLLPLPEEPYDTPKWLTLTVGHDHALVIEQALYSVPYTLGKCQLRVRVDRVQVKMYLNRTLVKIHPRQPIGGRHIDAADVPEGLRALVKRDCTTLFEKAAAHGPAVEEYARRLAEGPLPWSRIRFVYRLLGLAGEYGGAAMEEACCRALELAVVDVTRIQRMLEKGLVRRGIVPVRPPPEPSGTVLRFSRSKSEFAIEGGPDASA
ncbi:MAG: transposase family protein, partial [Alphaproteobacteria bacterium]|nr:transposase family protein [Alphaproteobacteria bacterium]